MMIQSQRRVFLSLRHQFHSYLKFNSPISQQSRRNPNPISRPFSSSTSPLTRDHQSRHFRARCLISYNSSPLISNWSFQNGFNGVRGFATRLSESSNRPPKETIMLAGCDFEHWLVVVEAPDRQLTRDEIIDGYIKTLAHVIGSEKEARMKIYSVSTRHYYAFGALVPEELADKLKEQSHVRWVLPDSYFDVKNKTYAGEPFINGEPVPYDPKYHEIWLQNHEHSLRNNMKSNRRQRDPNSSRPRPRSLPSASAHGSPNQNSIPAAGPQNQALQTSNIPNRTSRLSSPSHPDVPVQNTMPSTGSPNQAPPQSQMQNPTRPPFSQSHSPQYSEMQSHSSPWTSPSPPSSAAATAVPNQSWGNQNQIPVTGSQNQAQHPSQMQKQPPPPSPTSKPYTPTWNGQSQSWERASGYQSPSPQPPISNNNYSYDSLPSPATVSGMPSHRLKPDIPRGNMPPQVQQNNYSYRDIPHHLQNSVSQNGYPPQSMNHQQYQNNYSDMQSSNAVVSSQRDWNYQKTNMTPSGPARDMPSHVQNSGIGGGETPSPLKQNGYSYRDIPGHAQNDGSQNDPSIALQHQQYQNNYPSMALQHQQQYQNDYPSMPLQHQQQYQNGYPSMPLQHQQQYQNGYPSMPLQHQQQYQDGYRNLQSSNAVVSPQGSWNCQSANLTPSAPPRDLSSHMQNPDFRTDSKSFPAQLNGPDKGIPQYGYQSQASQSHQYQNTSRDLQGSDVMATPQGLNNQNWTPPMQNSSFPNTNMTSQVQNHWSQGADAPRVMQHHEYGHNVEQAAEQVDSYTGGAIPSVNSSGTVQPRDYQERDTPTDEECVYASK